MEFDLPFSQSLSTEKILIEQGHNNAFIENLLAQKGIDAAVIEEIMKQVKHIRNAKRTRTGSRLVLIGVILLGIGCISCLLCMPTATLRALLCMGLLQ
ncbi:MAG TPA: hypothetical protein VGC65_09885 [Bacteroidia bacterium]|jgi:hypothetical protein